MRLQRKVKKKKQKKTQEEIWSKRSERQHQQWTCAAATIKTNLSQPTRRLHVALSVSVSAYVYVSGGFLVGLTRTDVGKKRQQQQQKQRIHNQFQKSDSVRS